MGVLVQLMSAFHVKDFFNALKLLIDVIKIIKKKGGIFLKAYTNCYLVL